LKELELTAGRATRISAVLKSLEDNWSPLPKFNTDEDRSFFEIALLFVKQWLEVQLKSLNTVLEMANITTRAKPKKPIFLSLQ
jgi:ATP-dependent DNA helicase RecG